jgi:predicted  nucleic acid-binding Zn-ribbon protein
MSQIHGLSVSFARKHCVHYSAIDNSLGLAGSHSEARFLHLKQENKVLGEERDILLCKYRNVKGQVAELESKLSTKQKQHTDLEKKFSEALARWEARG